MNELDRLYAAVDAKERQRLLDEAAIRIAMPHAIFKPRLFPDGNQWCALYGENLQEGLAGFGDTPAKACDDFNKNFRTQRATS